MCVCVLFLNAVLLKSIFKWINCRWREDDGRYVSSNVPLGWPERQIKKGRRRWRRRCGGNLFSYPIDNTSRYYRHTINTYLFHSFFFFFFCSFWLPEERAESSQTIWSMTMVRVGQFFVCVYTISRVAFCISYSMYVRVQIVLPKKKEKGRYAHNLSVTGWPSCRLGYWRREIIRNRRRMGRHSW